MRLLLVTDAWFPQVNGVVRTLSRTKEELEGMGCEAQVVSPDAFRTMPCPTYPEIRLAAFPGRGIWKKIESFQPCAIHIATEGPLGLSARRICLKKGLPFTTAYHTKFPEYISARFPVPVSVGYRVMRWFHRPSRGIMVATPSLRRELEANGFGNIKSWGRGVDTELFRPREDADLGLPGPIFLYVGRVAVEKNIEAFLSLNLGVGTKVVVGDGPQRLELSKKYPDVHFLGARHGADLARAYAAADVFVFPSLTDTFGLVLLEALASGVPVAAYPVTGPRDVVGGTDIAVLDEDLGKAALAALKISRTACRDFAERHTWRVCSEQFLSNLHPFPSGHADRRAA